MPRELRQCTAGQGPRRGGAGRPERWRGDRGLHRLAHQGTRTEHLQLRLGCPCQFNELPSRRYCRAAVAMRIERGAFRRHQAGTGCTGCRSSLGRVRSITAMASVRRSSTSAPMSSSAGRSLPSFPGRRPRPPPPSSMRWQRRSPKCTRHSSSRSFSLADIEARVGHFSVPAVVEAQGRTDPQSGHEGPAPGAGHPASRIRVHRG